MTQSPLNEADVAPLSRVYGQLRAIHPNWWVHEGEPVGTGWIDGRALCEPNRGALQVLLTRIGQRMCSSNRKVIAAAFALRFGWSSAAAIGPYIVADCVPDVALDNVALRFSEGTLFERVALRRLQATALHGHGYGEHPLLNDVVDRPALLDQLRRALLGNATPVVDALSAWSRLNCPTLWGQVLSSWGSQFAAVCTELGEPLRALELIRAFFDAPEPAFELAPTFYPIEHAGVTRVYHRRGSCCLYYKTGAGNYCAACPLISEDVRRERNCALIERTLEAG